MAIPFMTGAGQPAPDGPQTIPYIPNQKYVDKNLAPEKIDTEDVTALARARGLAEKTGVLSPALGQWTAPIALTEGRAGNFGVNPQKMYASPANIKRFTNMGLTVQDEEQAMKARTYDPHQYSLFGGTSALPWLPTNNPDNTGMPKPDIMIKKDVNGDKFLHIESEADPQKSAKMMMAILSEKASHASSPEEAVKLWNGKVKVKYDDGRTAADPEQYLGKVQAVKDMLENHPKNTQLREHYYKMYR